MLELLIEKIKQENQQLQDNLKQLDNNNFVYETVRKILNDLDITEVDTKNMLNIISQNQLITSLDEETLKFILLILLPNGIKLETSQRELLNKLLKIYPKQMNKSLLDTISKNEMILSSLESNELFIYFDELQNMFKQYDFNYKEQLIIMKELIQRNYHARLVRELEEVTPVGDVEVSINPALITSEDNSSQMIQEGESVKELEEVAPICDAEVFIEPSLITNEDNTNQMIQEDESVNQSEPVVLNKEVIDFFKRNKLYYSKLDDNLKRKINNHGLDIEKAEFLIKLLKKIRVDVKAFYNQQIESFVNLILYSKIEYISEMFETAHNRSIDCVDLIYQDYKILYSQQFGGHFENFMANIDFLDSLNYDYKSNTNIVLYCVNNANLKSSYDLFTNVYKLRFDVQNICILAITEWTAVVDQLIEISRNAILSFEQDNMKVFNIYNQGLFYILKSFDYQTRFEYRIPELVLLAISKSNHKNMIDMIESRKDEMNSYRVEKTDLDRELDEFFLHETCDGDELWIIPHIVQIIPEIFENEYVSHLESNYRVQDLIYSINKTRVSRIKVLRVLSYLSDRGVEITKDVVKYALKFNYIFTENDLENINNVFNQKKKIWK